MTSARAAPHAAGASATAAGSAAAFTFGADAAVTEPTPQVLQPPATRMELIARLKRADVVQRSEATNLGVAVSGAATQCGRADSSHGRDDRAAQLAQWRRSAPPAEP